MPSTLADRRRVLAALAGMAGLNLAGCAPPRTAAPIDVFALFAGRIDDHGFMQAGFEGLVAARDQLGARVRYIDGVKPETDLLTSALRESARGGASLVIAHGGQNNGAAQTVAAEFPGQRFVVTQGNVTGANLSSYEVLQEQSAWLAGALSGLMTRTGVVGHMSGIRVRPGLKGRAAFADGLRTANPRATLLTNFSGNQDDNALSRRIALAQMDAGADIIFTMLNAGRSGATEACRSRGTRQIGNVGDWTQRDPVVFVASAVADVSRAVFLAARDHADGSWKPGVVRQIGLSDPGAVRLAMGPEVPADLRARIATYAGEIVSGARVVPEAYHGPEFVV